MSLFFWSGRRGSNSLPGIPRMADAIRRNPASPLDLTRSAPVEAASSSSPLCQIPKEDPILSDGVFFCDCPQVLLCLQSAVCSCEPKIFFRSSPKISSNGAEQLLLYSSAKICLNYCGNLLDRITRPHKGRAIYSNS